MRSQEFWHAIAKIPKIKLIFVPPPFHPYDTFNVPLLCQHHPYNPPPHLLLAIQLSHFPHLSYKLDYLDYQHHSVIR